MKRVLLATAAVLALALPAQADVIDPLHLFCGNCGGDNGTFTPFQSNVAPLDITVDATTPGQTGATGTFILKVLIPVDGVINPPSINTESVTGLLGGLPFNGAANLATSPITGGVFFVSGNGGVNNPSLESNFLGISTSDPNPPNRLNTFLGTAGGPLDGTLDVDPNAVGFAVLTLNLGNLNVPEQNAGPSPFDLSFLNALPAGSWILGDVQNCVAGVCTDVTTAPSAALFATPFAVPGPIVGAGLPGLLAALGMLGLNRRRQVRDWWRKVA